MTRSGGAVRRPAIPIGETIVLVGTLGAIYIVSQFFRNSIGVIAPNLADELSLSAAEIGLLSSAFFFAFAASQIPLGIGLDRYGPKICMLICAAITVLGGILFAFAASPPMLITARILMGIGGSCYLMAPLAVYARRYPPDRFGTLVGIQMGVGSIGTLLATAPLAWSVSLVGWRHTFIGVAVLMLLAGLLVALVVREDEPAPHESGRHETLRESIAGTLQALRMPSVTPLFLMNLCAYSSFILVVGLWGGPYLTHIYGFGLTERGDMLFVAAVAQIVGAFLYGPTDRLFGSYKIPVLLGAILTMLTLGFAAFVGRMPDSWLIVWFVLLGALSAYTPVMIAHGKSLFPPQLVGRGMTLLNIGSMGGVFLTQTVTGFVIDAFPAVNGAYPLVAYRVVFALQALALLTASIAYFWARDPWRKS